MSKYAPPLLSRILLVVTAIMAVSIIFIFVSRALEPVVMPPPLPVKQAQSFSPKADVSKNIVFGELQLQPAAIPDFPSGRDNPFKSPFAKEASTGTAIGSEAVPVPGVQVQNKYLRAIRASTTTTQSR